MIDTFVILFNENRPLSVDYAAKLRNSYMSPSSVSSGGEFDSSKDGEHPLGIHPSSPSSLANRLAAAHGMSRKRNHLVDDDLMDGDNSSDIMPVVPSRQRSCSRDGGVDDIAVPDDDDDIHETGKYLYISIYYTIKTYTYVYGFNFSFVIPLYQFKMIASVEIFQVFVTMIA